MNRTIVVAAACVMAACGAGEMTGTGGGAAGGFQATGGSGGSGGSGGGTGTTGGGSGADAGIPKVTPDCAGFCNVIDMAACGDAPANCATACQQQVDSSPACSNIQARFFNCIAGLNPSQVQCVGGVTEAPSCDSLAQLTGANGCAAAVNNVDCYGAQCRFDSDCGSVAEFSCGSGTDRCIKKGTTCTGLPCRFDSDCGDLLRFTCNSALNTCVTK